MRVAQPVSATWRGRKLSEAMETLDIRGRAIALARRLSEGEGIFARVKAESRELLTRIHKARSETQPPSAIERLFEMLVGLKLAGAPSHQIRLAAVEAQHLCDDLDDAPVTNAATLAAIHAANVAQSEEALAESRLTTRGDRELTIGDIEGHEEATMQVLAASAVQLTRLARLKRQLRRSRGQQANQQPPFIRALGLLLAALATANALACGAVVEPRAICRVPQVVVFWNVGPVVATVYTHVWCDNVTYTDTVRT